MTNLIQDSLSKETDISNKYVEYKRYFTNQLKDNATQIKRAKELDRKLNITKTKEVKQLLEIIKTHRSLNNEALVELNKKTNTPNEIYSFYVEEVDKLANSKYQLFNLLEESLTEYRSK
jgi:hypothetical protein